MLRLEGLAKRFDAVPVLEDATLTVAPGEIVAVLGPSGEGKTTLLRLVAGLLRPDAGRVWWGEQDLTPLPAERRGIGMVFQSYALFPHLDVAGNVAFGLRARRWPKDEVAARVAEVLAQVGLPGFERRRIDQLSGGQQQRVALARALAPRPPVLLLDEPLSNLDAALRERTRAELRLLLNRAGVATLWVTHDQDEAFAVADRIAVLHQGRFAQVDDPVTLYHRPATLAIAQFVGRATVLPAEVETCDGPYLLCRLPGDTLWTAAPAPGAALDPGDAVRLFARPEGLRLVSPEATGAWPATVVERRFLGGRLLLRLEGADGMEAWAELDGGAPGLGARVGLAPKPHVRPLAYPG